MGTPTHKGPSQHQEGKGDLLRALSPLLVGHREFWVLGAPGMWHQDTACPALKRGQGGGGRVQALSQVWGTPGMWVGAHLGGFCQAECPVIPQDPRGHRPGVS